MATYRGAEAEARLARLGIEARLLNRALERGEEEFARTTDNCPPGGRGHVRWTWTVAGLREGLVPRGWSRDDSTLNFVVSSCKTLRIATSRADELTGRESGTRQPRTKNKGLFTIQAIEKNEQLDLLAALFGKDGLGAESKRDAALKQDLQETWFLLYYRGQDRMQCELSRPSRTEAGRIVEWAERILLPDVDLDGGGGLRVDDEEVEVVDVELRIERR